MKQILLSLVLWLAGQSAISADMSNSLELSHLYIIGDATPYDWDLEQAAELQKIGEGVFRWSGQLQGGKEFKFLNTREFHKHIVGTSAGQTVVTGKSYDLNFELSKALDDSRDFKFKPSCTGEYTVYVDLLSMKMAIYPKEATVDLPSRLYVTGTALEDKTVEIPLYGNAEFKATLNLQRGSIILQDTPVATASTHYYLPRFEGVDVSFGQEYVESLKMTTDAQAEGWSVSLPGKYTLYAIKDSRHIFAKRFKPCKTLFLVGGCCTYPWDYWTNPSSIQFTPNAANPEELVWEGYLSPTWNEQRDEPNKLKILTSQDWTSETYHPYVADTSLIGKSDFRSTGGDDIKWQISEAGNYRITVNTASETICGELRDKGNAAAKNSETTSINHMGSSPKLSIWSQGGKLYLSSSEECVKAMVYAVGGNVVSYQKVIRKGVLADHLVKGVYFVKAVGANHSFYKKVLVE